MDNTPDHSTHPTSSRPPWSKGSWIVWLVTFVVSGAAIYWATIDLAGPATQYEAQASVRIPPSLVEPSQLTDEAIGSVVLSEARLIRSLKLVDEQPFVPSADPSVTDPSTAPSTDPTGRASANSYTSLTEQRSRFRVTISPVHSNQIELAIGHTDTDPNRAIRLANALAEDFALERRSAWEAAASEKHQQARAAADHAKRELWEAKARRDRFLQEHFTVLQALGEGAEANLPRVAIPPESSDPSRTPSGVESPSPKSETIVNGELGRSRLLRKLDQLERQREELLVERTERHPVVQDLEDKISSIRDTLAATPRPAEVADDPLPSKSDGQETAKTYARFHALAEAVDRAQVEYDQMGQIERRAWDEMSRPAPIEYLLAKSTTVVGHSRQPLHPGLLALAAALVMASGAGLVASGIPFDPLLCTPAQVERTLDVPVLATLPNAPSQPLDQQAKPPSEATNQTRIIVGVVLILLCGIVLGALFWTAH